MRAKIGALLAATAAAATAAVAAAWAKGKKAETDPDARVVDSPTRDIAPAPSAPVAAAPAGATPAVVGSSEDDLTSIKGLGAVTARRLADAGVTSFAQIAAWSDDDIAAIGSQISVSPGRIKREDWVGQAAAASDGS